MRWVVGTWEAKLWAGVDRGEDRDEDGERAVWVCAF